MGVDESSGADHRPTPPENATPRPLPETVHAGLYLVDENEKIIEVNRAAERLLGRSTADLFGEDAHELLHRGSVGQNLSRTQCSLTEAFFAGRTCRDEGWFQRGDGSLLPVSWIATPCAGPSGRSGALVLFYPSSPGESTEAGNGDEGALPLLERLALLAETTTLLTSTLDIDEALRGLIRLVVPRLVDWVIVDLITEGDEVYRRTVATHEDGDVVFRDDLRGPMPPIPQKSTMPLSRALRGAASTLTGPEAYHGPPDAGIAVAQRELFRATGMHSAGIAPIRGLREVLGALTFGCSDRPEPFSDLALLEDIARRAGLALDNARLYQRQRHVTETMQRHLLPQLSGAAGLEMYSRYVPAPQASQVGGDWYDAFPLPDGALAVVIGDVAGHDLEAAANMAQVRSMLRAYGWSYSEPPSAIVHRLDQALEHVTDVSLASLIFGRIENVLDDHQQLRWANAGHPPPLLVTHDGQTIFLEGGHGPLVGTGIPASRTDDLVHLPPQCTLLLYTDGLVESPSHSLEDGLDRLRRHAAALAHRPLQAFCDLLLSRVRPDDNEDDVVLLALRTSSRG
ncbi:SpoIIE family protein phosphatase [Streptomyces sp. TP-A0874]|uniref:SpoIIE family protein phosphatase n=1 Tax=Streptomyces sp. TP-A0874 TaxID=549819 RepID=UPI000852AE0E|nr:SpoIIE family protein phosphatase [Streptomyces sp. TP-A0874]